MHNNIVNFANLPDTIQLYHPHSWHNQFSYHYELLKHCQDDSIIQSTNKKGISSTELSRKLGLRQKTCWLFKQKVMKAMESSGNNKIRDKVEVDETVVVGGQEEGVVGRKNKKKKIVVFAIEKQGKAISRIYGKVVKNSSAKKLGSFMKSTIDSSANIKTDQWAGYKPLVKDFANLIQIPSGVKGRKFS